MSISQLEKMVDRKPINNALAKEFAYDLIPIDLFDTSEFAALHLMLSNTVRGVPMLANWEKSSADLQYSEKEDRHRILILGFGASADAAARAVIESGNIPLVIGARVGGQAGDLISHVLHEDTTRAGGGTNILHTMSQPGVLSIPGQWVDLKDVPRMVKEYDISAVINATGSLKEKRSRHLQEEYDGTQVITIRELVTAVNQAIRNKESLGTTKFGEPNFIAQEGLGKTVINDGVTAAEIMGKILQIESARDVVIDPRKLAKRYPANKKLKESQAVSHNLGRLSPDTTQYHSNVVVGRGSRGTSRSLAINAKDLNQTREMLMSGELKTQFDKLAHQWHKDDPKKVDHIYKVLSSNTDLSSLPFLEQKELIAFLSELTRQYNGEYQKKNRAEFSEWQEGVGFSFIPESTIVGVIRHPESGKLIGAKVINNKTGRQQSILANLIVTGHGTEPNLLDTYLDEELKVPSIDVGFAVSGTTISGAAIEAKKAVAHLISQLSDLPPRTAMENTKFVKKIHDQQAKLAVSNLTQYFIENSDRGYAEEWLLSTIPTPKSLSEIPHTIAQYNDLIFNNPGIKKTIPAEEKSKIDLIIKTTVFNRYLIPIFKSKYPEIGDDELGKITLQYQNRLSLNRKGTLSINGYASPATQQEIDDDIERWMQNQRLVKIGAEIVGKAKQYKAEITAALGGILTAAIAPLANIDPKTLVELTSIGLGVSTLAAAAVSNAREVFPQHKETLDKAARVIELLGIGMLGAAGWSIGNELFNPTEPSTVQSEQHPESFTKHAHGFTPIDQPQSSESLTHITIDTPIITPSVDVIPIEFSTMTDKEILAHVRKVLGDANWVNNGPYLGYEGRPIDLADVLTRMISANRGDFTPQEVDAVRQVAETTDLADLIKLKNAGLYENIFGN